MLFSAPMVRAILDGSKTQTRRVMKNQPFISRSNPPNFSDTKPGDLFICPDYFPTTDVRNNVIVECLSIGNYHCMGQIAFAEKHSPFGISGDQLWVKETWQGFRRLNIEYDEWEEMGSPKDRHDYEFTPVYKADNKNFPNRWQPSIFMPRDFSRIQLEITSIRIERLNNCSESDCIAEGAHGGHNSIPGYLYNATPGEHYKHIWESINGLGSWDKNPWVWVVEFKVLKA